MNYLTRMMTAQNPRLNRLAEKIIAKRDRMTVSPKVKAEHLRNKYRELTGKLADKRWSDETLLAKLQAAEGVAVADGLESDL